MKLRVMSLPGREFLAAHRALAATTAPGVGRTTIAVRVLRATTCARQVLREPVNVALPDGALDALGQLLERLAIRPGHAPAPMSQRAAEAEMASFFSSPPKESVAYHRWTTAGRLFEPVRTMRTVLLSSFTTVGLRMVTLP
jgi:hypothetical protein